MYNKSEFSFNVITLFHWAADNKFLGTKKLFSQLKQWRLVCSLCDFTGVWVRIYLEFNMKSIILCQTIVNGHDLVASAVGAVLNVNVAQLYTDKSLQEFCF